MNCHLYEHEILLQPNGQEEVSHEKVMSTIKEHHQIVLDQIEYKNKEALIELKDKSEEVSHLRHKVDEELVEVLSSMHKLTEHVSRCLDKH
jgi:hypothetical protein